MSPNRRRTELNTCRTRLNTCRTRLNALRIRLVARRSALDTWASDVAAATTSLKRSTGDFDSGARCSAREASRLRGRQDLRASAICGAYIDVYSIRLSYNIKKRIDLTAIRGRGSNT